MTRMKMSKPTTLPPISVKVNPMNHPANDEFGRPRARLWFLVQENGGTEAQAEAAYELETAAMRRPRSRSSPAYKRFKAQYEATLAELEAKGLLAIPA